MKKWIILIIIAVAAGFGPGYLRGVVPALQVASPECSPRPA